MRAEEVEALGSLEALRQKWQHDGKHLFFQALYSFHDFCTQALVCGFVCWRCKVRRDVILAIRGEFGGVTLVYSA